jgi:hypothetical protein
VGKIANLKRESINSEESREICDLINAIIDSCWKGMPSKKRISIIAEGSNAVQRILGMNVNERDDWVEFLCNSGEARDIWVSVEEHYKLRDTIRALRPDLGEEVEDLRTIDNSI